MSTGVMLVSGGSRGIGAAIVKLAARRGYDVAFTYARDPQSAEIVAQDVRAQGRWALPVQSDVGRAEDVASLFEQVAKFGTLSALVCNGAITGKNSRLDEASIDTMREVLNVNVLGVMLCAREGVLRVSTRHGGAGGSIVLISSRASLYGAAGEYVWYAASKGAIDSFNLGLAREVGREGIRVNAVSPGPIDTQMHRPGRLQQGVEKSPMGRAGTPDEVAEAVLYITSPGASYINGANLSVAGGA